MITIKHRILFFLIICSQLIFAYGNELRGRNLTKASDSLADVFVYPNSVRLNFTRTMKIAGLTDKANVKIADMEWNLVFIISQNVLNPSFKKVMIIN